jgi:hypothetical protein
VWLVPLTKCELVTQLIPPSKTSLCNIKFAITKICQNSKCFLHLRSKSDDLLWNHLHKIPLIESFPTIIASVCPQVLSIFKKFIWLNFQWQHCSIFNNSWLISIIIGLTLQNHLRCAVRVPWFGKFQCDKQIKHK